MIKHIVMWKFKPDTEKEMNEFLTGLKGLYGVIPQIREQEVGVNCLEGNYDAVLISVFDSMADLKAYAIQQLTAIPDLILAGKGTAPHVLSVSLVGWPSANIVTDLSSQGICISAGSACHQGRTSHVVAALKLPKKAAGGVIRISFGPESTKEEIDLLAAALRTHHDTRMPLLSVLKEGTLSPL